MEINYIVVCIAAVLAMVLGFVWYGILFKKKWMEIIGVNMDITPEEQKRIQKKMIPMYLLQFVLVLLQVYVLAHFVQQFGIDMSFGTAIWIWIGFVMPTIASGVMWTNTSKNMKLMQFLIHVGYNLVVFALFGFLLGIG